MVRGKSKARPEYHRDLGEGMTRLEEATMRALKKYGFDGLYSDADEIGCGCRVDDLMPCCTEENLLYCRAGYLQEDGESIGPKPRGAK
jgi:hypothetical protein